MVRKLTSRKNIRLILDFRSSLSDPTVNDAQNTELSNRDLGLLEKDRQTILNWVLGKRLGTYTSFEVSMIQKILILMMRVTVSKMYNENCKNNGSGD